MGLYLANSYRRISLADLAGTGSEDFYSLDYVPIFPWFGVVLIGMGLGDLLYRGYRRRFYLPDLCRFFFCKIACILGQKFAGDLSHPSAGSGYAFVSGISLLPGSMNVSCAR